MDMSPTVYLSIVAAFFFASVGVIFYRTDRFDEDLAIPLLFSFLGSMFWPLTIGLAAAGLIIAIPIYGLWWITGKIPGARRNRLKCKCGRTDLLSYRPDLVDYPIMCDPCYGEAKWARAKA